MSSIADAIGKTPMVQLAGVSAGLPQTLLAKCEFMNPGGSVKDRIAFHMVACAEADGRLKPGQLMVEATGGNTGIGLALAARLKGYPLLCVMSEKVGIEKVQMMQVLGAETLVVPAGKAYSDPDHPINRARQIAAERGGWFVDQFANTDNLEAHYLTTGPEIWEQTEGKVDALVAGIGTGGTLLGAGKYLRQRKPSVKLVLADPAGSMLADWVEGKDACNGSYIVEGIGGDFVPGIVDLKKIDYAMRVKDSVSVQLAHELLEKEALFVGSSSGCIVGAAIQYCQTVAGANDTVVAILPSTGRYYTKTIFDKDWLKQKL